MNSNAVEKILKEEYGIKSIAELDAAISHLPKIKIGVFCLPHQADKPPKKE